MLEDVKDPQVILIGTGSEVWPAVDGAKLLAADGIRARVVSMPSWKIFEEQIGRVQGQRACRSGVPKVAIEAGATLGWWKYVGQDGAVIGIDRFGASAPGPHRAAEARLHRRECGGQSEGAGEVKLAELAVLAVLAS